jgi:hypothetical protein
VFSGSFNAPQPKEYSLPPSGENLHWKEGFKPEVSGEMIVMSGAAPQEQRLKQPNGNKTEGSHLD